MTVWPENFISRSICGVQIYSKTDSDMRQSLGNINGPKPDILIASEDDLRTQKQNGVLQPYESAYTDNIPSSMKDIDGMWSGLWYNPMGLCRQPVLL